MRLGIRLHWQACNSRVCVLQGVGAVASRRAAELYGLEILEENINDAKDNVTRFIKLAR